MGSHDVPNVVQSDRLAIHPAHMGGKSKNRRNADFSFQARLRNSRAGIGFAFEAEERNAMVYVVCG